MDILPLLDDEYGQASHSCHARARVPHGSAAQRLDIALQINVHTMWSEQEIDSHTCWSGIHSRPTLLREFDARM